MSRRSTPVETACSLLTIASTPANRPHLEQSVTASIRQDIIDCQTLDVALSHISLVALELAMIAGSMLLAMEDVGLDSVEHLLPLVIGEAKARDGDPSPD